MQKSTGKLKKLEPLHWFLRWIFQTSRFRTKTAFRVQDDEWHHTGEICPKNFPKSGVNWQFQAKTPKSIHRNISRTITQSNYRFEDRVQTTKYTTWVVRYYPEANSTWLTAAILKISYNIITPPRMVQIGWNLASNHCQLRWCGRNWNRK